MTRRGKDPEGTNGDVVRLSRSSSAALLAALPLSVFTRRPFEVPDPPAWLPALALACGARIEPVEEGERVVPLGALRRGPHRLALPPEESMPPVLAALACALASGSGPAEVHLSGTTHPREASGFHDFTLSWMPLLERTGLVAEALLDTASFDTDAGGLVLAYFFPSPRLRPFELVHRGVLSEVRAIALVCQGGAGLVPALERLAGERLRAAGVAAQVEALPLPGRSRGPGLLALASFEQVKVTFLASGDGGRSADELATSVAGRLSVFLSRRGAVDSALAQALLVPAALAASRHGAPGAIAPGQPNPSRWTTAEVTVGLLEAADVVRSFLEVDVQVQGLPGHEGRVEVRPRA